MGCTIITDYGKCLKLRVMPPEIDLSHTRATTSGMVSKSFLSQSRPCNHVQNHIGLVQN